MADREQQIEAVLHLLPLNDSWNPDGDQAAAERIVDALAALPSQPSDDRPKMHLPTLLAERFGISTSEARRCIAQGGVRVDGAVVRDLDIDLLPAGRMIQLGRRRKARIEAAPSDDRVREAARRVKRAFLAAPPLGEGALGFELHGLCDALDSVERMRAASSDDRVREAIALHRAEINGAGSEGSSADRKLWAVLDG